MQSRIVIESDGFFVHSRSIGRLAYALYRRYPRLFVRHLKLEKLLLGGANWYSAATHARLTGDLLRPSTGLAESPYVELLNAYRRMGDTLFAEDRFAATPYCQHALQCIKVYGRYFSAVDTKGVIEKAKNFCRMLDSAPLGPLNEYDSAPGEPVEVRLIRFSDCFEIVDGHHRLALAYVRGVQSYPCAILPTEGAITPIQQMIIDPVWLASKQRLTQPIPFPELKTWSVLRQCTDRFKLMTNCLAEMDVSAGSFLDIGSNYGWFVAEMSKRGFSASGVEQDAVAAAVGPSAYGIDQSAIHVVEPSLFLRSVETPYDVVCCLSVLQQYVLKNGKMAAEDFIRLVDRATGTILFLDTAENHERDYLSTLKDWDAEHIRRWLRDNTSFSKIDLLGTDSDGNRGRRYGRHLFACIR